MRADLRKQMLIAAVLESTIVPKAGRRSHRSRAAGRARGPRARRSAPTPTSARLPSTDAQVAEFYDKNKKDFETPESAKVEYLVLSAEAISGSAAVADADVKAYYEQNKGRFGVDEQRRASHILFAPDGGDKAAARKKAEAALAALKANPGDFAKIAKEQSKDPGSAAQGGDLGFFGKGMMVKPFEEVAFTLKPGETSDIVETDFGFHIIRVTEVKPAQVKPLEEVRADIEKDLRTQQAQKRFAEAADQFTNLVYEQSDSLQPAAEKLGLKVQTLDVLPRTGVPAAPNQPQLFTPRVVEALFAEDSLKSRRNTQAIEVAPSTLVCRARARSPARRGAAARRGQGDDPPAPGTAGGRATRPQGRRRAARDPDEATLGRRLLAAAHRFAPRAAEHAAQAAGGGPAHAVRQAAAPTSAPTSKGRAT